MQNILVAFDHLLSRQPFLVPKLIQA
jgi:hypothetical protein